MLLGEELLICIVDMLVAASAIIQENDSILDTVEHFVIYDIGVWSSTQGTEVTGLPHLQGSLFAPTWETWCHT